MNLKEYYTTGAIAQLLNVSNTTVTNLHKNGTLIPAYVSEEGYRYYTREQYEEIMKTQGITISDDKPKEYMTPCWRCGTLIPKCSSTAFLRVMCNDCREEYEMEKQETLQQYIALKKKVMYERALRILEKSEKVNMIEIEDAAKAIEEYSQENPDVFFSSHEMIAAMVLINKQIKIKMQFEVLGKRLDVYIPEYNCGVEIDGFFHKGNELKDSKRDIMIRQEMGKAFEIIRIPTKYVEINPMKIPEYIKEIYNTKRKLRMQNNGFLPDNFSKMEKEIYKTLVK